MKKIFTIVGVVVFAVAAVVGISAYLLARPIVLGNMNGTHAEPTTKNAEISFSAKAGEKIKFSFRSSIRSGDLDMILYDAQGKVLYELAHASALETFYKVRDTGTYTLKAHCKDFVGDFRIKVLTLIPIREAFFTAGV